MAESRVAERSAEREGLMRDKTEFGNFAEWMKPMDKRLKVYLETSFVSYLTGRPTTREPIASWQASSRQWWAAVASIHGGW